ncbi:ADP-ribosylation factor Arf1 [Pelomyxa schiedti]|nr:ADP-ribosylation factor Arf1 [Pelomyxa schiedti]
MGSVSSAPTEPRRVLMFGLDAAGKTTALYKMKLGEVSTVPDMSYSVEEVKYKNMNLVVFDVGGEDRIRSLWKQHLPGTKGVIVFVDSADVERMDDAREQMYYLLGDEQLRDAPLLVFANKQDLPSALPVAEITAKLGLPEINVGRTGAPRDWYIQASCATSGDGLPEGFEWLIQQLEKRN